ncbi:MAG: iron-containing alcohol dehydrogenase [Spirochaetaceae bacterium]|jgi:alcohol dehydrogenase class IV|nr:iron-containing alcohol dehydrogenase [Spirochaetaceae bacterium]
MSDKFNFTGSGKVLFGEGKFKELLSLTEMAHSILICGKSFKKTQQYTSIKDKVYKEFTISGEPEPETINNITASVKGKIKSVIAVGGGSSLDAGKAVAAMCQSEGLIEDYLEGLGTKEPTGKTLPVIAIPTTAGTGSEATKNAVICSRGEKGYKKSLRHDNYIPQFVIIDPLLYINCPSQIMSSCGMDAFCQLLESYISTGSNFYTDTLAWKGITIFIDSFADLCTGEIKNIDKMGEIAFAAYLSGITLANAGLGTVHGIAGPMGGFYEIPHGTACGTLLPVVIKRTVEKLYLEKRSDTLEKIDKIGSYILKKTPEKSDKTPADALNEMLDQWLIQLKIPRLSVFAIDIRGAEKIASHSGNKNNPIQFRTDEIKEMIISRI